MKNRTLSWWWILVAMLPAVGCATAVPVVRLTAEDRGAIWVSGRETLVQDVDGVKVAAAFERGTDGVIALRVELQNDSAEPVEISPNQMWYRRCSGPVGLTCTNSFYVRDPEAVLAQLDVDASRQKASAANAEAWTTGLVLLSAVGTVAEAASGHPGGDASNDLSSTMAYANSERANHQLEANDIESHRQLWTNVALRRTTVFSGRGAGGQVFLPVDFEATFLHLGVQVGARHYHFVWHQDLLDPEHAVAQWRVVRRSPRPVSK